MISFKSPQSFPQKSLVANRTLWAISHQQVNGLWLLSIQYSKIDLIISQFMMAINDKRLIQHMDGTKINAFLQCRSWYNIIGPKYFPSPTYSVTIEDANGHFIWQDWLSRCEAITRHTGDSRPRYDFFQNFFADWGLHLSRYLTRWPARYLSPQLLRLAWQLRIWNFIKISQGPMS